MLAFLDLTRPDIIGPRCFWFMVLSRVGLMGDVHANDTRLETALRFFKASTIERILCVGDVVDGEGDAERCCRLLREYGIETVRGNHDRWLLTGQMRDLPHITPYSALSEESMNWLRSLPATCSMETIAGKLLLGHGLGIHDMAQLKPDDYGYSLDSNAALQELLSNDEWRFVIGGHTHQRMVRRFARLAIVNPGALSETNAPCIAVADFERNSVSFHDFKNEELRREGEVVPL